MAGAKKYETTINKVNEILGDLKNKIYHPIYLLHGEEPYFIDIITNYIENNILSNEEKDFNQTVVYGKDTTVDNIHALARQYPMFSDHRVVIVKEAQDIKNITELKTYAQNPLTNTKTLTDARNYSKSSIKTAFLNPKKLPNTNLLRGFNCI